MRRVEEDKFAFANNLEEIINKLEDAHFHCRLHSFKSYTIDKKLICMLLPVLDHIVNKFSSDVFFRDLKYKIEKDLNVRIHYSSICGRSSKQFQLDNQVLHIL